MVPHSHSSIEHAEEGINALSYELNNTLNTQTTYVRLENKNSGCFSTTTFNLIVKAPSIINGEDSYVICETNSKPFITAPEGFDTYEWSIGESIRIIRIKATGDYILTVSKTYNTTVKTQKTITVYEQSESIITKIKSIE